MHEEGGVPRLPENQANWDRALRIALGVALFAVGLSGVLGDPISGALRLASLVPLATGALGWCPIYDALGHGTRRTA